MEKFGDTITTVAQPIAKTIDYFLGTDLQNCGGCHQMHTNLNSGMSLTDAIYFRFVLDQQEQQQQQIKGEN